MLKKYDIILDDDVALPQSIFTMKIEPQEDGGDGKELILESEILPKNGITWILPVHTQRFPISITELQVVLTLQIVCIFIIIYFFIFLFIFLFIYFIYLFI